MSKLKDSAKDIAMKFRGRQDCYVHAEMKNGGHLECLVSGSAEAILYGLVVIIRRLGFMTRCSFDEVIDDIKLMHSDYEKAKGKDHNTVMMKEDFRDREKEEIRAEVRKEEQAKAEARWRTQTNNLIEEIELLESTLKGAKANLEAAIKAKDEQIKTLSKENLALEHQVDKLIEKVRTLS